MEKSLRNNKKRDVLIQLLLVVIYFSSSMVLMGTVYRPLPAILVDMRYLLVGLGFFILLFIYLKQKKHFSIKFRSYSSLYLYFTWFAFSSFVILSEIIHNTFPVQGIFFLVMIPIMYFSVMPSVIKVQGQMILWGLLLANLTYLVDSYLTVPFMLLPYSGIAANPNGFGQMGALTFICALFLLLTGTKRKRIRGFFIRMVYLLALAIAFMSVIVSASRTSFIIMVISSAILIIYTAMIKKKRKPLLLTILIVLIVFFSPLKNLFFAGLIEKAQLVASQGGGLLDGRSAVWQYILDDAKILGNGESYFDGVMEGAHNSIFSVLAVYGYIPALFLTAFLIYCVYASFRYAIVNRRNNDFALLPFVMVVTFCLFSLTEAMFGLIGNGVTVAFFNVVGFLFFKGNSIGESDYGSKKTG